MMELLIITASLCFTSFCFYSQRKLKLSALEDENFSLINSLKKLRDSKDGYNKYINEIERINNSNTTEGVLKKHLDEQKELQQEITTLENEIAKLLPEYKKKKKKLDEEESRKRRERNRRNSYYYSSSSSSSSYSSGSSWGGGGGGFSGGGASGGW